MKKVRANKHMATANAPSMQLKANRMMFVVDRAVSVIHSLRRNDRPFVVDCEIDTQTTCGNRAAAKTYDLKKTSSVVSVDRSVTLSLLVLRQDHR